MITAAQAAIKTRDTIQNHKTEELMKIDELISSAINQGESKVYYDGSLSNITIQELRRLGYGVETGSQYNQGYVKILW